ncbi:MAG TPA: hypothetical protein VM011_00100 [Gammaproteobacteria bacterium]|nr:hypothetical protein [Gammaproteobacteria bacterium]
MKFVFPLSVLMVLHSLFVYMDVYSIPHLDSAMHFIGGIALGIFIFGMMGHAIRRGWCPDPGKMIMLVLIVSLVALGAVCWEIYEWLSDAYLGTHFQLTLDDTVKDLVLGLAGGIVCTSMVLASGAYAALSVQGDMQPKALKSES